MTTIKSRPIITVADLHENAVTRALIQAEAERLVADHFPRGSRVYDWEADLYEGGQLKTLRIRVDWGRRNLSGMTEHYMLDDDLPDD